MPRWRLRAAAFGRNCTLRATPPGILLRFSCTLWGFNMPPALDWRSPAAYAYLDKLNPSELAWEFLRRNSDYQRDYRAAATGATGEPEFSEQVALRWGLPFPDRSGSAGR